MKNNIIKTIYSPLVDIFNLVFPNICSICEHYQKLDDNEFCLNCISEFEYTDHDKTMENELHIKFLARVPVLYTSALLYFYKDNIMQQAMHQLKYRGSREIAFQFGKEWGETILSSNWATMPDVIIPVPIHDKRRYLRGYNQAEEFAKGISEILGIEISNDLLIKKVNNDTQTKKSRIDRLENVLESYALVRKKDFIASHVLIVDDVCTTGATLEACALKILDCYDVKVSFGIIALAQS